MIELQITASPDEEVIGEYKTFKNDLIIGRSLEADLPIEDQQLDLIHGLIRLTQTSLFIKTVSGQCYYLLNGKKFSGEKRLKANDHLTLGSSEITIRNYLFDPDSSPGDFKEYYKKTIAQYPETGILLEVLEREIADLSDEQKDDE